MDRRLLPTWLWQVRADTKEYSGGSVSIVVWQEQYANLYVLEGIKDWAQRICSPTVNCQPCSLTVRYESRPEAFGGLPYSRDFPAATAIEFTSNCSARICDNSLILINCTSDLTGMRYSTELAIPRRWFNMEGDPTQYVQRSGQRIEYYDFRSIMRHEVGHWYGLGHAYTENEGYCEPWDANYHRNNSSAMNNALAPNDAEGGDNYISEYDNCAFKLAYCCTGLVSVDEESVDTKTLVVDDNSLRIRVELL